MISAWSLNVYSLFSALVQFLFRHQPVEKHAKKNHYLYDPSSLNIIADKHIYCCSFSRAIWPRKTKYLSAVKVETYIINGDKTVVGLLKVFHFYYFICHLLDYLKFLITRLKILESFFCLVGNGWLNHIVLRTPNHNSLALWGVEKPQIVRFQPL